MLRAYQTFLGALLLTSVVMVCSAQDSPATTVIYLLDVSGSMNRGGLFNSIQKRLSELVAERRPGDVVILGTFSESVQWPVKVRIEGPSDIQAIQRIIMGLKARGPWTWMSTAFAETVAKAQESRAASPQGRVLIYILTDCINDPPPEVKGKEPPWKFLEVLLKYFEGFKAESTNVYLLSYRPLTSEEKQTIESKTPIVVREPQAQQPIPRIRISPSRFDFQTVDVSEGKVTKVAEITVEAIQDVKPGETLELIPPDGFEIEPRSVEVRAVGQRERLRLTVPSGLDPGPKSGTIRLWSRTAEVEPGEIPFTLTVVDKKSKDQEDGIWKVLGILLVLLAVALLAIIFDGLVRTKSIWVEAVAEERIEKADLKGWQKVYLGERLAGRYLNFGLPRHYLRRAWLGSVIYLGEETGNRRRTSGSSEDFPCKDPDGREVVLRFHEQAPATTGRGDVAAEAGPEGPSPLDSVKGIDE